MSSMRTAVFFLLLAVLLELVLASPDDYNWRKSFNMRLGKRLPAHVFGRLEAFDPYLL